jgi:hypothetical protein
MKTYEIPREYEGTMLIKIIISFPCSGMKNNITVYIMGPTNFKEV